VVDEIAETWMRFGARVRDRLPRYPKNMWGFSEEDG